MPADARHLSLFLKQIARTVAQPRFVKVGANDGLTGDPCGDHFLTNTHWTGLLIEPVPHLADQLRLNYADRSRFTINQVAVGRTPGTAVFYCVSDDAKRLNPDLPSWCDQLGSFDRRHIINHDARLEPFIRAMEVPVEPLQQILERHGFTDIDFLQIDTEGHDLQVLHSVDLGAMAPLGIWVEYKHLSAEDQSELRSYLEHHGYEVWVADGDYFAVHREALIRMLR